MTRCIVAHPSGLVRDVLRDVLECGGIRVLDVTDAGAVVVEKCRRVLPDVALMALRLSDGPILRLVTPILKTRTRLLVVCDDPAGDELRDVLLTGASGCLSLQDVGPADIVASVRAVDKGDAVLHPAAANAVLNQWRMMQRDVGGTERATRPLTRRERQILELIAEGLTTTAMARRLGVAAKTIESHKSHMFSKLGARNQAEAVAVAVRHRLLIQTDQTP